MQVYVYFSMRDSCKQTIRFLIGHLVFSSLSSDSSELSRAKNGVADRSKILFDILLNQGYCYLAVQVKRKP